MQYAPTSEFAFVAPLANCCVDVADVRQTAHPFGASQSPNFAWLSWKIRTQLAPESDDAKMSMPDAPKTIPSDEKVGENAWRRPMPRRWSSPGTEF